MIEIFKPLIPYIIAGIFIVLLMNSIPPIIKRYLNSHKKINTDSFPYKLSKSVLTDTELSFFNFLISSLNDEVVVFCKVGLKDIFYIEKSNPQYMSYFSMISQKHVDFLICLKDSLTPLCGIELDDHSHNKPKTVERDTFVNSVYASAGLHLIHIAPKKSYVIDDLTMILHPYLIAPVPITV